MTGEPPGACLNDPLHPFSSEFFQNRFLICVRASFQNLQEKGNSKRIDSGIRLSQE
jgi:hypothetical protein